MIKRRSLLKGLGLPFVPLAQAKSHRPKILVFLLADDMRWDAYTAAGHHRLSTPNFDWIATAGHHFRNHFVTTSICPTSRASILLGQYARRHGIWDFSTNLSDQQKAITLPNLLRAEGFRTALFGKWGIGTSPPSDLFDHWQGFMGQGNYRDGSNVHLTDRLAEQVKNWIRHQTGNHNLAIFVNTKAPHVQDDVKDGFIPADRYKQLYADQTFTKRHNVSESAFKRLPTFLRDSEGRIRWQSRFANDSKYQETTRQYHRLIKGVDDLLGTVLSQIDARYGLDQSVIVVSSDNGFFLGEHGLAGKWWGYEESIRTPLLIRSPALGKGSVDQISLNIDIAPTILELLNLSPHEDHQGTSLVPDMRGESSTREDFFYEHLFTHPRIAQTEGTRTARFKYLHYPGKGSSEMLFDLQKDPYELENLVHVPAFRNQLERLRIRTQEYKNNLS